MLGKKSSLKLLLNLLSDLKITNVRTVRFMGGKTTRWAVAWSFTKNGENLLTQAGKSSDPKIIDIASLAKSFHVKRSLQYSNEDILKTITKEDKDTVEYNGKEKEDDENSVSYIAKHLLHRVKRVFESGLGHLPFRWRFQDRIATSDKYGSIVVQIQGFQQQENMKLSSGDKSDCNNEDSSLIINIHIDSNLRKDVFLNGTSILNFGCICTSPILKGKAQCIFDAIAIETQRVNRAWRHKLIKSQL